MNNKLIEKAIDKLRFSKRASHIVIKKAKECIKKKNKFTLVLSGGKTVKDIYLDLAKNHKYSIDWSKVHFFWLDERCVKPTDKNSNYKLVYSSLIKKISCFGSINRMRGEISPAGSAREYENILKSFFKKKKNLF